MRASAYLGLCEHYKAIQDCDRILQLDRQLTETYTIRGFAYRYLDNQKALTLLQEIKNKGA